MRKTLVALSFAVAAVVSTPVLANVKVAIVDTRAALYSTNAAKKMDTEVTNAMKPQRDRMAAIQKEVNESTEKFKKNQQVMSDKDKASLQNNVNQLMAEYQQLGQVIENRRQATQQELLQSLLPKFEKVVEDIRKAEGYTIILERSSALYADPSLDLTKKITERLNAAK